MSMRESCIRAACIGLLLAVSATTASAANLLVNPGFETGDLTGWLVFGQSSTSDVFVQSPDNGPSAPGTHHAFMANQHEALALVLKQSTAPGSAVPGTVYYSFDLKMGEVANGGVFFVNIFAEQAGGGVIGGSGLMGPLWPQGWTPYQGSFVAPANTDFLTIQFEAVTGAVVGSTSQMHVDNADLNQGSVVPSRSTSWGRMKALYR